MVESFDSINSDGYIAGSGIMHEEKTAVKLTTGDYVKIKATDKNAQVLFISSKAFFELVVWGGPIVMNTKEELNKAFDDLRKDSYNRQLYIKKSDQD